MDIRCWLGLHKMGTDTVVFHLPDGSTKAFPIAVCGRCGKENDPKSVLDQLSVAMKDKQDTHIAWTYPLK